MGEVRGYETGEFCWIELATDDLEGATAYYTTLFGWTIEDQPVGDGGVYRTCRADGRKVLGMFDLSEESPAPESPRWNAYVSVADVDQSITAAETLGGAVSVPPFGGPEHGRKAVIEDPTGARLGLWQPGESFGAEMSNEPGSLTWVELQTGDCTAAGSFYSELFGWGIDALDADGTLYTSFTIDGGYTGGCVEIPAGEEAGPAWLVYLETDDVDALVSRSEELGGTTMVSAQDVPDAGRFAILRDPQGASFGVLKTEPGA